MKRTSDLFAFHPHSRDPAVQRSDHEVNMSVKPSSTSAYYIDKLFKYKNVGLNTNVYSDTANILTLLHLTG